MRRRPSVVLGSVALFGLLGSLVLFWLTDAPTAQGSGTALPDLCTPGATFTLTQYTPPLTFLGFGTPCVWTAVPRTSQTYALPDATPVDLFTVTLPTANTGCALQFTFAYTATNGTNAVAHSGLVGWAFANQAGTVTGNSADGDEVVAGLGCGPGCDTFSVSIAGTTATGRASFNNTLSVTGAITYRILASSCPTLTPL